MSLQKVTSSPGRPLDARRLTHIPHGQGIGGIGPQVVPPLVFERIRRDNGSVIVRLIRVGLLRQPPEGGGKESKVRVV